MSRNELNQALSAWLATEARFPPGAICVELEEHATRYIRHGDTRGEHRSLVEEAVGQVLVARGGRQSVLDSMRRRHASEPILHPVKYFEDATRNRFRDAHRRRARELDAEPWNDDERGESDDADTRRISFRVVHGSMSGDATVVAGHPTRVVRGVYKSLDRACGLLGLWSVVGSGGRLLKNTTLARDFLKRDVDHDHDRLRWKYQDGSPKDRQTRSWQAKYYSWALDHDQFADVAAYTSPDEIPSSRTERTANDAFAKDLERFRTFYREFGAAVQLMKGEVWEPMTHQTLVSGRGRGGR